MESRVESHAPRVAAMNAKPAMFQAGLSTKFTKRHVANFHDTTLAAASAAKARAELKMERQANAIEKQQLKIEHEMKKIEAITEKLQRQQAREAKRLRSRLTYAASRIQNAFRAHVTYVQMERTDAAIDIQRHWRGWRGRERARETAAERTRRRVDIAARVITRTVRIWTCRLVRRHEIHWRAYAATTIQSVVRRHHARRHVASLRHTRDEQQRAHHASIVIQSHARGFLTRLVYMDVLFLVCRIQSVARGFLVRKRLRWLLSLNLHAIVELQALARGFLVRRQIKPMLEHRRQQSIPASVSDVLPQMSRMRRVSKPFRSRLVHEDSASGSSPQRRAVHPTRTSPSRHATYALATMATMAPPLPSPPRVKRSYWLPSGTATGTATVATTRPVRQRLPQLVIKRPLPATDAVSPTRTTNEVHSLEDVSFHVVNIQRMIRGKLSKQRPPQRLAPLEPTLGADHRGATHLNGAAIDDDAEKRVTDDRREKEDILKRKLMVRRAQEKKRLELESAVRQQQEREEAERKLLEREEKLTRLWEKTTQRKQQELKMRKLTLEQQREEKERMEMLREERLARLHLKRIRRVAHCTTMHRRGSLPDSEAESSESDPESDENPPVTKDRREENERVASVTKALIHPQRTKRNINAAMPVPVASTNKSSKQRTKPNGAALKKTRELRAVYGGAGANNQTAPRDEERSRARDLQTEYAAWNFHSDELSMQAELVEDDAEFDYGNDFEDVVEETRLTRLLC